MATAWRVLRKETDDFIGPIDAGAFLAYQGDEKCFVDHQFLVNEQQYFYKAYYLVDGNWTESLPAIGMPSASYEDASTDVLLLVRDRLDNGLRVEVERGAISHEYGALPVLTAPPVFEDTRWPCVTVHLETEGSQHRAIGEMVEPDFLDDDEWIESEGWLASVQLQIVGWSLNPDERIELRKAIRRVLQANLSVFDSEGMIQIELSQRDTEDFTTYSAAVYQSMSSFSCTAPARIKSKSSNIINEVNATNNF